MYILNAYTYVKSARGLTHMHTIVYNTREFNSYNTSI